MPKISRRRMVSENLNTTKKMNFIGHLEILQEIKNYNLWEELPQFTSLNQPYFDYEVPIYVEFHITLMYNHPNALVPVLS